MAKEIGKWTLGDFLVTGLLVVGTVTALGFVVRQIQKNNKVIADTKAVLADKK